MVAAVSKHLTQRELWSQGVHQLKLVSQSEVQRPPFSQSLYCYPDPDGGEDCPGW